MGKHWSIACARTCPARLLQAYQHPRSPELKGIALGHVADEPSGGGIKAIADGLDGKGERVSARA